MESHRSEKKRTIFWSAAAIILMVCIFGFSTQSGTESNGLSMKVTKFFAELLFFRFDSMDIGQQTFIITELNFFIRKLAHFTVYTALGMVVYTAVVSSGIWTACNGLSTRCWLPLAGRRAKCFLWPRCLTLRLQR